MAAVVGIAEQSGRLVVEVLVDGNSLSEDDLQESTRLEANADQIQVLTTTMETLLHETFVEVSPAPIETSMSRGQAVISAGAVWSFRWSVTLWNEPRLPYFC